MLFTVNTSSTESLNLSQPAAHVISIATTSTPVAATSPIATVPFLSQFVDIQAPKWKAVGCGVTSLAMVINFFEPDVVSVNTLLWKGVSSGAYLSDAGWTYKGLIALAQQYGLDGTSHDLAASSNATALKAITNSLADGPVIASIHYKFNPKSTIPHLVVINGIKNGMVYYNDPAAKVGNQHVSTADFMKGWKKRYIVVRPATASSKLKTVA